MFNFNYIVIHIMIIFNFVRIIFWMIYQERQQLEGDKKITTFFFLQFSLAKSIFLGVPLILSLIGLYFISKFKSFRINVFYKTSKIFDPHNNHQIFIEFNDKKTQIAVIKEEIYHNGKHFIFMGHFLKYEILQNQVYPVGSQQQDRLQQVISRDKVRNFKEMGLLRAQFEERLSLYGRNQHKVQIPGFFFYAVEIMSQPLFVFQYFIFFVWYLRGLLFSIVMITITNIIIIIVNYYFLYKNFKQIKDMAENIFPITVIRQSQQIQITNEQLIPGDIFKVVHDIPCDCILLQGDIMVNQVNFTGQNLPILKYKLQNIQNIINKAHWLYEGSEVLQLKAQTWAMAIFTGFTSHRGRIIRKIINNKVKQPDFAKNIIWFFIHILVVNSITYLVYLPKLLLMDMENQMVFFIFILLLTITIPIGAIGFVHMLPGFSLERLKKQQIIGKQPYKVYEIAQVKTICFDKTGTLTQNKIQFADAYILSSDHYYKITNQIEDKHRLVQLIFACCHLVKKIGKKGQIGGQQFKGDQIDLRMFQKSKAIIKQASSKQVLWQIQIGAYIIEVYRVNQFQSKHMSMSVLVRDVNTNQLYIFAKGSPQLIHRYSINHCKSLPDLIKQLSFKGFRSIGFAYKTVNKAELSQYLEIGRQKYLQGIEMVGVASFVNKLKEQTFDSLNRLKQQVGIQVKMITGDNIYTAIQTAFKAGIISADQTVAVFEGKNWINRDNFQIKIIQLWKQDDIYQQKEYIHSSFIQYFKSAPQSIVFAIEGCFLSDQIYKSDIISKIKVFARTSPQDKTLIIKNMKNILQNDYKSLNFCQKIFNNFRTNISMVGDGANDLMAIKQADVGIALSQSDGSFSADFVIRNLSQIQAIIRQGKSISQTVIEVLLINGSVLWQTLPLYILMLHDYSAFRDIDNMYRGFIVLMPIPFILAYTRPISINTTQLPQINIMSLKNQLRYWLNNIVYTLCYICIFQFHWSSEGYIPIAPFRVVRKIGLLKNTQSNTVYFFLMIFFCLGIPLNHYQSTPWKQPIYKNKPIIAWIIIHFIIASLFYFQSKLMEITNIPYISNKVILFMLGIMILGTIINTCCNFIILKLFNSEKQSQLLQKDGYKQEKQFISIDASLSS